jgi:hypothetical protein
MRHGFDLLRERKGIDLDPAMIRPKIRALVSTYETRRADDDRRRPNYRCER